MNRQLGRQLDEHTKRGTAFNTQIADYAAKLTANTVLDDMERLDLANILVNCATDAPCMVKAADDEPVFVLRGQDAFAADTVEAWIDLVREGWGLKFNRPVSEMAQTDPVLTAKLADAAAVCAVMRAYKRKFPD